MNTSVRTNKGFYYPPGGILIWIIIFLELVTFAIALLFFVSKGKTSLEVYFQSASKLNLVLGTINTGILLVSGFFAAMSLHYFKSRKIVKSKRNLILTLLGAILFVGIKSYEYLQKSDEGIGLLYNDFFTFYWLLTGFHLIHILVGIVILLFLLRSLQLKKEKADSEDLEAGISFWHMCDLIWLMLFPALYLIFLL